jgi:hypothetical protein
MLTNKNRDELLKEIKFFLLIGTISFIADLTSGKDLYDICKEHDYSMLLLYMHHLFASFIYFGWISKIKLILILHIAAIVLAIFIQSKNEMRCPSTDIINRNCNIIKGNALRDFLFFSEIKGKKLYHIYLLTGILISIYKLYKN